MDDEDSSSNGEQPAARHAYNALDADNQVRAMDEEESDDPVSRNYVYVVGSRVFNLPFSRNPWTRSRTVMGQPMLTMTGLP